MATIRKKGDFQWHVQVRKKGFPAKTKTFTTKVDAERWGKETEVAMERGLFFDRTKAEKTTMSELIERYRREVIPTLNGKHARPALNALEPVFGAYALCSVSSEMICKYRDNRLRSVAESTVKKEINLLSKIIDLANKEWGVPLAINPCTSVKRPIEPKGRDRRLKDNEEELLLQACRQSCVELEVITIVAIESAARLGELLKLKWEDTKLGERSGSAKLCNTKNGEDRGIPLSPRAVTAMQSLKLLSQHTRERVFWRWAASDSFNKTWARTCKRAGIKDLKFHDLRHEACSRLAPKYHMHELMKITGHKTAAMLDRYYHPKPEDLAKRLE